VGVSERERSELRTIKIVATGDIVQDSDEA